MMKSRSLIGTSSVSSVATIVALDRACQTFEPERIVVDAETSATVSAAEAFGRARRLPVTTTGRLSARPARHASDREA